MWFGTILTLGKGLPTRRDPSKDISFHDRTWEVLVDRTCYGAAGRHGSRLSHPGWSLFLRLALVGNRSSGYVDFSPVGQRSGIGFPHPLPTAMPALGSTPYGDDRAHRPSCLPLPGFHLQFRSSILFFLVHPFWIARIEVHAPLPFHLGEKASMGGKTCPPFPSKRQFVPRGGWRRDGCRASHVRWNRRWRGGWRTKHVHGDVLRCGRRPRRPRRWRSRSLPTWCCAKG